MEDKLIYSVLPKESFEAEGRVFLKGVEYPVYDRRGNCVLCAENGSFLFTSSVMEQAIEDWELEVVEEV